MSENCVACGHSAHRHTGTVGCLEAISTTRSVTYCPCERFVPAPSPITPYAGTSGWSGSDTSRERAERDDSDGTTRERVKATLTHLSSVGAAGATWKELALAQGWHHGEASGVLSRLHKARQVARLGEKRNRCAVYVLPSLVGDRETSEPGRQAPPRAALTDGERRDVRELRGAIHDGRQDIVPSVYLTQRLAESLLGIIDRVAE